jgi:Ca2+-binding RTX toxin-like protein
VQHVKKFAAAAAPLVTFEALEGRRLMSATLVRGVLTVEGTDAADTIYLFQDVDAGGGQRSKVFVQLAPDPAPGSVELLVRQGFPADAVRRVVVRGGGGDDTVSLGYVGINPPATRAPVSCRADIDGGEGNDTLRAGAGRDRMSGGAGNDYLDGSGGNDAILAGDGDDIVLVAAGRDVVSGGAGKDFINAAGGGSPLGLVADGGEGDDNIHGAPGKADRLTGGAGNDLVGGNGGRDRVLGGDGDDLVTAGADPRAVLVGGPGRDSFDVPEEEQDRPRIRDFNEDEDNLVFPIRVVLPERTE